jgi:hypothetical protein
MSTRKVGIAVLITVGSGVFNTAWGAQALSCGQTNECLSIRGEVRLESQLFPITQRQEFEVITDGVRWHMRVFNPNPPTNSPPFRQEYGFDGQSVYAVSFVDTNYTGPRYFGSKDGFILTNFSGRKPTNNGTARIIPGSIPRPSSLIGYIWLAYLSGCELKQLEANAVSELPDLYVGGNEADHLNSREPARWVLSRDFPFSPARLEFFGGGMYGFSEKLGTHRIVPSQPFTNLALVVESTTNSGAWTVPARFSFMAFRPPSTDNGASTVGYIGRGVAIAIARVPPPKSFLPTPPSSTRVEDWRLNTEEPASYYVSERWLSIEEVKRRDRR